MDDHHERPRHHRRRRPNTSPDAISWVSYIILNAKRHYHWFVLLAVILAIMLVGMGAPVFPIDEWTDFWKLFV